MSCAHAAYLFFWLNVKFALGGSCGFWKLCLDHCLLPSSFWMLSFQKVFCWWLSCHKMAIEYIVCQCFNSNLSCVKCPYVSPYCDSKTNKSFISLRSIIFFLFYWRTNALCHMVDNTCTISLQVSFLVRAVIPVLQIYLSSGYNSCKTSS